MCVMPSLRYADESKTSAVARVRACARAAARPAGPPPIMRVSTICGRGGMVGCSDVGLMVSGMYLVWLVNCGYIVYVMRYGGPLLIYNYTKYNAPTMSPSNVSRKHCMRL